MTKSPRAFPFAASAEAVAAMFLDTEPASDPAVKGALESIGKLLGPLSPAAWPVGAAAAVLDYAAVLAIGRPLHAADADGRRRVMDMLARVPLSRNPLWMASLLHRVPYLLQDETLKRVGSRYGIPPATQMESARWRAQVQLAKESEADVELEAEVVIIGSGAGGAAAAYELASRGVAVAIVEAGGYFDRADFDGEYLEAMRKIYRFYPAVGNGFVSILAGQSVGGTTTINSGTCFRAPDEVLAEWRGAGLHDFTSESMAPWFNGVERMLGVEEATSQTVGPLFDYVAKGARELGFHDVHRLRRNAPGCDGQGLCAFGCPTAAKRSADVSYVPAALQAGAFLYAGFRVEQLEQSGNRITGISAVGRRADGSPVRLRIQAPNVIVAMGTIQTPLFLAQQGVKNPHLGRHLTIHPTGLAGGIFDGVDFQNERTIPQGVGMGDLAHEGIRFEGATPPLAVYGAGIRETGARFKEVLDAYANTAFFGFMISDKSEGRVRRGIGRHPLVTYSVNDGDLEKYVKSMVISARIFFRAGARKVNLYTFHGDAILSSEKELDQFANRKWRARHFNMTAYHPLGTARIAVTPEEGVCDSEHRVFGTEGLYVMDGSNVPTSLGVNPQMTIMAMASRAAARLADRLTAPSGASAEHV